MKRCNKPVLFLLIPLFLQINAFNQINSGSIINIGSTVGDRLIKGASDKKKAKLIQSSLSETEINGKKLLILRVPEDKIPTNIKFYVTGIQKRLNECYERYNNNEHIRKSDLDDIDFTRAMDPEWPVKYYVEEWDQYKVYETGLTKREQFVQDSTETVKRLERERHEDSLRLVAKNERERLAYINRIDGYHFINKEAALLKERPDDKSQTLGKIHVGSYIEVKGYSDNSPYLKVALKDITGYIRKEDVVDNLDKITVANADIATYKTRQYYKYDPNYDYVAPVQAQSLYQQPSSTTRSISSYGVKSSGTSGTSASSGKTSSTSSRSSSAGGIYITGPRGGCYYINSNGNKTYVDHSYCR